MDLETDIPYASVLSTEVSLPTPTDFGFPALTSDPRRVTPPAACSRYPEDRGPTALSRPQCDHLKAFYWSGCPSGFTSACNQTVTVDSVTEYTVSWSTGSDGTSSRAIIYDTWETAHAHVICCPDVFDYTCQAAYPTCRTQNGGSLLELVLEPATAIPEAGASIERATTTISQGRPIFGYAVTASYAEVTKISIGWALETRSDERVVGGPATTAWCDADDCADLPTDMAKLLATETAAQDGGGAAAFTLRPPPDMGNVGPLGIFAVSGLFAALSLVIALLAPWAWLFRHRRMQQTRSR